MLSRIFNSKALLTAIITLSLSAASSQALEALTLNDAETAVNNLLDSSKFPSSKYSALKNKIISALNSDARKNIVSVIRYNGYVFSLYLMPADSDEDYYDMIAFDGVFLDEALFCARNNLAFSIGQNKTDRDLYIYDEPLGFALSSYYSRPREIKIKGIESISDIITSGRTRIAAALAWIAPEAANIFDEDIPSAGVLDEDYCRMLYTECANVLFRNGLYSEALPMFRNIHRLHWANVNAYIDAAECFLMTGESGECVKLLKELIITLEDKMSCDDLIRAGRLFRRAGDRSSALSAFKLARKRYREGQ